MKFVAFPTARDRSAGTNGRLLSGDELSAAPPSGKWVYCPEEPPSRRFHRVFGDRQYGPKMDLRSSIDEEAK